MQEFEFVDNGVFEKDGVEYRNKGQVEIEDKLFYLFVTSDVPNFAPLYLKDTKRFVVLVVTGDKAREATEEERVILQCKCRRCINCGEVITKKIGFGWTKIPYALIVMKIYWVKKLKYVIFVGAPIFLIMIE